MAAVDVNPRYDDLCRLCGNKTTIITGLNIFTEESSMRQVEKKIKSCLPFQIERSDHLPKMICEHCLYKLELSYEFREKAVRTQSLLIEIYKITSNKTQSEHHQPVDIAGLNHNDFIVQQQHLLTEHNIHSHLDLHLEHRIVNHSMVLDHHNVGIDAHHPLDGLDLHHPELTNQDSLETGEMLSNHGSSAHYNETEIGILQQHTQILNEQYRIHPELHPRVRDEDSQETPSEIIEIKNVKQEENSNQHSIFLEKEEDAGKDQDFNNDWLYDDQKCPESFPATESLAQHLEGDDKSTQTAAESKIDDDQSGNDEQREEAEEDPAEAGKKKKWSPKLCKECGKTFKTNSKLTEHMRKHTGEKPYKCGSCEKTFRSKIGLAQHEAKHTGQYDFACPTCGKGFQCKSYLMVHQRVHSDVKPYPCTTCGRNFKTKQSLLDHTNRHLGVKPYVCEICGRGFITKGLCKAHQKVHTGTDNRKYSCKVCNKMFVSKSYLQTHLRIHTGEKPFMCEVCGKGFLTRVDLRIHSTMHTGEKSYVCEICGKAFARRDALHCHRRSHTGERPYSCDLCGQTFTQFSPMAIHKRLHTGERPYACEVCGKTFVSKSTMMSHSKKHVR